MVAMTLNDGTYYPLFTIQNNNIQPGVWTKVLFLLFHNILCKILIIWLQLSFSFMYLTPTVYTAVNIVDLGDVGVSSNPFYVDDVSLIAYEHDFSVNVLDACGQNLTVPFSLNYFAGIVFFFKVILYFGINLDHLNRLRGIFRDNYAFLHGTRWWYYHCYCCWRFQSLQVSFSCY